MRPLPKPSKELDRIVRQLRPHIGSEEVTLPGASFDMLVSMLINIRKMAENLEREAGALRLAEASRHGRAAVEKLATEQFEALVIDPDGKIIRPEFGKGGK
ncbi:hypothetical protein D4A92_19860 [Rhizobium rosettiformans]|uniref:Uncharacterized protein n=1 Tax=Rhizobium rosettiformans TaxID=1368430 RepID=A0ABX7F0D1_9HYPH|nr:hypothetical protein [Rhizobium rosettiformans]QRF53543.1 hypothetical protein D4A92_19860 [Rhizobium rosettiformans]